MSAMSMNQLWQLQKEERALRQIKVDLQGDIQRARRNAKRVGALKHREKWISLASEYEHGLAKLSIEERISEIHAKLRSSWVDGGPRP